jgi:hypothetical protein
MSVTQLQADLPEPQPEPVIEAPIAPPMRRRREQPAYPWAAFNDDQLLQMRMCDLRLRLTGSWLQQMIRQVQRELAARNLSARPHFWLSEEWFTPDGVPGIAIPFYLGHPRLMELEHRQMLEVEGGSPDWCLRILRHEIGHAVDNAYRLHRRKQYIRTFGKATATYPEYYRPKPYSKSYVLHLDYWYAQSHPAEDFAETFAVWLTPNSMWEKRFAGWPAMKKLQFVDELMKEIAGKEPPVKSRERDMPLRAIRITLGEHYERKRARYASTHPEFYDRDLRKLFTATPKAAEAVRAGRFLRRIRAELRRMVSRWTGEYQYTIDQVIRQMIKRCEELGLWLDRPEQEVKVDAIVLVAVQTMNYLHSGRHRVAL